MAASEIQDGQWESQADIDACLAQTGVTRDQVNRWRREGFLPPVEQKPAAYIGGARCFIPLAPALKSGPRRCCFG